jgi:hypothetical protein
MFYFGYLKIISKVPFWYYKGMPGCDWVFIEYGKGVIILEKVIVMRDITESAMDINPIAGDISEIGGIFVQFRPFIMHAGLEDFLSV